VFKAIVPLKPEVKLGDYHSIRLEPGPVIKIAKKEVTAAMEEVRERQGAWVPVDRSVELGDLVTMDIQADVDGKPWLNHKVYYMRWIRTRVHLCRDLPLIWRALREIKKGLSA